MYIACSIMVNGWKEGTFSRKTDMNFVSLKFINKGMQARIIIHVL